MLDNWLKELFKWRQTWGTEGKFSMVCKDCVKAKRIDDRIQKFPKLHTFTRNYKFLALAVFNLPQTARARIMKLS